MTAPNSAGPPAPQRLAAPSYVDSASATHVTGERWILVAILLVGAALRWTAFGAMTHLLSYDEGFYALDAISLLHDPVLTPFFTANEGRESGWMYVLAPFFAVWGEKILALRVAAACVGVLTLAIAYRLAREVLDTAGALWAAAALAVLYLHVQLSHLALRAAFFPLVGALAFLALLRAHRTRAPAAWALSGMLLGLLIYTYYAARLWILYGLLLLAWWFLRARRERRGVVLAAAVAAVVAIPMVVYTYYHPDETLAHFAQVGVTGPAGVGQNVLLWLRAWFQAGDPDPLHNLPGRPIFDPWLGSLFLIGLAALPFAVKQRWQSLWILGLALSALSASLLSDAGPNFVRAVGLIIPLALIAGGGARTLERGLARLLDRRLAPLLPLGLLCIAGASAGHDFYTWLYSPVVQTMLARPVDEAFAFVQANVPASTPVYFSPFFPFHPYFRFRRADLAPRPIGAFNSHFCLIIPAAPAIYVSLTPQEPGFQQTLSRWADAHTLFEAPAQTGGYPEFTVVRETPLADWQAPALWLSAVQFGDALRLRMLTPLVHAARAGEAVTVTLGMRTLRPIPYVYSVFVHLYGDVLPEAGGSAWSQGDAQICDTDSQGAVWRPDETIIQTFQILLPQDLPPGHYQIAIGVYETAPGIRLPVTRPGGETADYSVVGTLEITGGGR